MNDKCEKVEPKYKKYIFKIHELSLGRLTMDVKICLLFHIIEIFGAEGWSSEAVSSMFS